MQMPSGFALGIDYADPIAPRDRGFSQRTRKLELNTAVCRPCRNCTRVRQRN